MRLLILAVVMLLAVPAMAEHHRNRSGADSYRAVVVNCMQTALRAGASNPLETAQLCIKAADEIWKAAYPQQCTVVEKSKRAGEKD